MNRLRPVAFAAALAGLIAVAGAPLPASAAQEDIALLKSYLGDWTGAGQLKGSAPERVQCKISLTPGNQDKVNYSGRCAVAGQTLSVRGSIAYNDGGRRYEAAMTSNVGFSGVAVGKKSGDGVLFNIKQRGEQENATFEISAAIALQKGQIQMDFSFKDVNSGQGGSASVPFKK